MRISISCLLRAACATACLGTAAAAPPSATAQRWLGQRGHAVLPPSISPLDRLGTLPRTKGMTLSAPYGLTLDGSGNLYAANLTGNNVTIYSPGLKLIGTISTGLNAPAGVATEFGGNILVANFAGSNITVYNSAYAQTGTIDDPALIDPTGIYVDDDNDIWVLDNAGSLHTYLSDGTVLPSVKLGATAIGPWGPYITAWGAPSIAGGLQENFQARGQAVRDNPSLDDALLPSPYAAGETEDSSGQQYVTDFQANQVTIWSSDGLEEVGVFGVPSTPAGIAVDSKRNRIYVALSTLNQIAVYAMTPPYALLHTIH